MAEYREHSVSHQQQQQQRIKQPISVPFLWEEKPGTPKRDWMPKAAPLISVPLSPARLIISVPFEWEEKPGKPLPCFRPPSPDPSPLPAPPWASSTNPFVGGEEEEAVFALDFEAFASEMHKEASGLTPLLPILQESPSDDSSNQHENWCSFSETDSRSNSSSWGVQNDGPDASVLEFLFPLSTHDAGFFNKVCSQDGTDACPELLSARSCDRRLLARRTLTLGELIMMSRKLSCRRTIDVKKPKFSMRLQEFISKNLFTCFPFKTQQHLRQRKAITPGRQQEVLRKSVHFSPAF